MIVWKMAVISLFALSELGFVPHLNSAFSSSPSTWLYHFAFAILLLAACKTAHTEKSVRPFVDPPKSRPPVKTHTFCFFCSGEFSFSFSLSSVASSSWFDFLFRLCDGGISRSSGERGVFDFVRLADLGRDSWDLGRTSGFWSLSG